MKYGKICNKINKVYLLFICFIYFLLFRDFIEKQIPILGYVDELIAFMSIPIFFSKLYKNKGKLYVNKNLGRGYNWYVLVFLISGLLGNFIYQYQPFVQAVLPDVFLCLKFWLSIAVGKYIFQKLDIAKYAKKIYKHIKMITWFYTILIVIDNIYPIFISDIRYGMRSTQLFYSHPTVFGACCVLMMIILLIIQRYVEEKDERKYFIWLSVLVCSTLRSKMFGCVMAFWLIYYFVFYRKKKFQLRTIVMFVPLVVLLGWSQIEYYFFSEIQEGSARYQLLVKSFKIAKEHFPIGAGFATFGSHYSAVVYSPLYRKYGIWRIWGLEEGYAYFVSDSYWPMVLAQLGWIGLIGMVLAIFMLFMQVQRLRKINISYYVTGLFILAYLMIESVASSAFVHPLSMPLALLMGYLLHELN